MELLLHLLLNPTAEEARTIVFVLLCFVPILCVAMMLLANSID